RTFQIARQLLHVLAIRDPTRAFVHQVAPQAEHKAFVLRSERPVVAVVRICLRFLNNTAVRPVGPCTYVDPCLYKQVHEVLKLARVEARNRGRGGICARTSEFNRLSLEVKIAAFPPCPEPKMRPPMAIT